jgi:hypothetical protein
MQEDFMEYFPSSMIISVFLYFQIFNHLTDFHKFAYEDWWSLQRRISKFLELVTPIRQPLVEAGSNTSTVALRVVRGDE